MFKKKQKPTAPEKKTGVQWIVNFVKKLIRGSLTIAISEAVFLIIFFIPPFNKLYTFGKKSLPIREGR